MKYLALVLLVFLSQSKTLASEWLVKAESGWKEIASSVGTLSMNCERVQTPSQGPSTRNAFVAWQGDMAKSETEDQCMLQNAFGSYVLQKVGENWQVVSSTPLNLLAEERRLDKVGVANGAAIFLQDKSLLEISDDQNYSFSDWSEQEGLVRCKIKNNSEGPRRFDSVDVTFDPENKYRIVNASYVRDVSGMRATDDWKYTYDSSPFVPSRIDQKFVRGSLVMTTEEKYSEVSHTPLPAEEFSLAHYGLRDPNSSSNSWIWIVSGLFLVFSLGFLFKYLRR